MSTAIGLPVEEEIWIAAIPSVMQAAVAADAEQPRDEGSASPSAPPSAVDALARLSALATRGAAKQRGAFDLLQQWEGVVVAIHGDSFSATLRDLTDPTTPTEVAELFIEDVAPDDRALLDSGAVFYWSVGYEDTHRGLERKSFIQFRRLPAWTRGEIARVVAESRELEKYFGGVRDSSSGHR
ncbi:MAG: hypothetical protein HYZ28_12215 [Myxococcales bacterium]|nr:hypothetical protein [Myxococcales bacterium]